MYWKLVSVTVLAGMVESWVTVTNEVRVLAGWVMMEVLVVVVVLVLVLMMVVGMKLVNTDTTVVVVVACSESESVSR